MRFEAFQRALLAHYGEQAAAVRHEIYFLTQRAPSSWRAAAAALRDAWLCWRLPKRIPSLTRWVALVTLPGRNGWGALTLCLADLSQRGIDCTVLIHPRLRGQVAGQLPARPRALVWRHALAALRLPYATNGSAVATPWVVRCCVFRQRLWRGVWERTLPLAMPGATLLLHNDFDLYAVAALQAIGDRWRSICVQHGLPTDEFFPVRAQCHLLWGQSSAQVYRGRGVAPAAIGFGPAWPISKLAMAPVPATLYLVSQTHTSVYGRALAVDFLALATALLQAHIAGVTVCILLHPEELRSGHPYAGTALAALCRPPPHRLFETDQAPALVVGFCSTALVQAACRGHYVIGMAWPAQTSLDALAIGRPAQQVDDAAALCALIVSLRGDAQLRQAFQRRQWQWLQGTFAVDTQWPQRLGAGA